jgi:hypothetical protein
MALLQKDDKVIIIDVTKPCLVGRVGIVFKPIDRWTDTVSVTMEIGCYKSIKNWFPYRMKKYEEPKWPY